MWLMIVESKVEFLPLRLRDDIAGVYGAMQIIYNRIPRYVVAPKAVVDLIVGSRERQGQV